MLKVYLCDYVKLAGRQFSDAKAKLKGFTVILIIMS